jgi:outer membrane murein-binding lipoprotein Lpp
MNPPTTSAASATGGDIEGEFDALERRLGLLVSHVKVLRATNDNLRRDLAASEAHNQALSERVAEAKRRLDALLARLPEAAE